MIIKQLVEWEVPDELDPEEVKELIYEEMLRPFTTDAACKGWEFL